MWRSSAVILLSLLAFSAGRLEEDNEFAEFEDEDILPLDIPSPTTPSPHEVTKEAEEVINNDFDGIYGEVEEEEDELIVEDKKTDKPTQQTDNGISSGPLKFADVPNHFRSNWGSYQVEAVVLFLLSIYMLNYLAGRAANQAIAFSWVAAHRETLSQQFSVVGDNGTSTEPSEGQLQRQTDFYYGLWCTGRVGCTGGHIHLKTIKRHDLLSRIWGIFSPQQDRMYFTFEMEEGELDQFVLAIGLKKAVVKLHKEMSDVSTFAVERKSIAAPQGFPSSFAVYSESSEAAGMLLETGVVSLLKKYEKEIEYIHVSDQFSGAKPPEGETLLKLPEVQRVITFSFILRSEGDEEETRTAEEEQLQMSSFSSLAHLLQHISSLARQRLSLTKFCLVFYIVEKLRRFKLTREAKQKAEKRRQLVHEQFLKTNHQARQEAAQARREEKTRERKQRLMEEGAKSDSAATSFSASAGVNPLAPGGVRTGGKVTPDYKSVYVFENDFPSFTRYEEATPFTTATQDHDDIFKQEEVRGECRVICYHPRSDKSIAIMDQTERQVEAVVQLWMDQFVELSRKWTWIQIFENRGAAVGCSNSHPHGQIWAGNFVPSLAMRKDRNQKAYYEKHGSPLLLDYLKREEENARQGDNRIVLENEFWCVLVPFWAMWPYETMLLPRRHVKRMDELNKEEQKSLASILRLLMVKYDNIFECSFAYGMGWLGAPTGSEWYTEPSSTEAHPHWQLHMLVHPPLLRSATIPKYMAGYEILAEPQRDITPEMAAKTIRDQSEVHYTEQQKKYT